MVAVAAGAPAEAASSAPLGVEDVLSTTPTPCPAGVTQEAVCSAGADPGPTASASPTATPSATPEVSPSPSASPTTPAPTPTGAPAASPSPSVGAGPVTTPPPAPPSAGASGVLGVTEIGATFKNAPFLGQLLEVLAHPSSAQPPDLRHFRLDASGDAAPSDTPQQPTTVTDTRVVRERAANHALPPVGKAAGAGLLAAAAIVATLVALAVADRARRRSRPAAGTAVARCAPTSPSSRRRSARRRLTTAVLCATAPLTAWANLAGSAAGRGALPVTATPASSPAAAEAVAVVTASRPYPRLQQESAAEAIQAAREAPPAWRQLLDVEAQLTAQQEALASQEGRIAVLAQVVAQRPSAPPTDEPAAPPPAPTAPEPAAELSSLVAAHSALMGAYQSSLKAEYDVYRAAAQDPQQRAQLIAGASQQAPDVAAAVAFNLVLVQTQLGQEAAIAAAEDRLHAFGGLGKGQLRAIREHQPFIVPLEAPITQGFGPTDFSLEPPLTYHGSFYPHFHTGIDLAGPLDTPVHAAADGVVLLATASVDADGQLTGYGNYIVIAHPDGFETLYAHLDSVAVAAGDVVRQGQIIGFEGSTGTSTGPHLHFEIRHDGDLLDPATFLTGQLQPLGAHAH